MRRRMSGRVTDISLHIDKTQPLADIVAYHDDVRVQRPPVLGARCIVELQPICVAAQLDLEYKRLINVTEERDRIRVLARAESPRYQAKLSDTAVHLS